MISITINGEKQSNANINPQWISEQINNRRRVGQPICISFTIRFEDINVVLSAGQCPSSGGNAPISSFSANAKKIIRQWQLKGFGEKELNPGMVISFWRYVTRFCN